MGHDVFVSHSARDKVVADAVVATLEREGIRCWVAPRDILPGATWASSILKAIESSRLIVLVFSSHVNSSEHVRREVERAVHRGLPIAPIRIEDVLPSGDLEYFLGSSHWMDALTPPVERHLTTLAEKVRTLLEMKVNAAQAVAPAVSVPRPTPPAAAPRRSDIGKIAVALALLVAAGVTALAAHGDLKRLLLAARDRDMVEGQRAPRVPDPTPNPPAPPATLPVVPPVASTPAPPATLPVIPLPALVPASRPPADTPSFKPVATGGNRDQRVSALRALYLDGGITAEQYRLGKDLLSSDAPDPYDIDRLAEFANVLEGRLAPDRLRRALDAIETPEQRESRADREEATRKAHVAELLNAVRARDNEETGHEALKLLEELLKLDPKNQDALALRRKITEYYAAPTATEWLAKARETAESITIVGEGGLRAYEVYRDIAATQAMAGDAVGARQTFALALTDADHVTDGNSKASAYYGIASAQAGTGDTHGACQAADRISDFYMKAAAYCNIASAQANAGDAAGSRQTFALALTDADHVTDGNSKAAAQRIIAAAQAKAGDAAAACQTADSINDVSKQFAYSDITEAQVSAGDVAGALQTADRIADASVKTSAYCAIAVAQAKAGDAAGARQTIQLALTDADRITDAFWKPQARREIAAAQAGAGDVPLARQTAGRITDAYQMAVAYDAIAAAQANTGDLLGARQTADGIIDHSVRASAYCAIAVAQAKAADAAGARQTIQLALTDADRIIDVYLKDWTCLAIAEVQVEAGDILGARRTADRISVAHLKASIYPRIAAAQAKSGDVSGVRAWAGSMSDPALRSYILLGAAQGRLPQKSAK